MPKFRTTHTKIFVSVVTLQTRENIKLLKQSESGFKRTINCNKYHSKKSSQAQNRYLNNLIDPSFQGVDTLSCFIIWRWWWSKKLQPILSSSCGNKKL